MVFHLAGLTQEVSLTRFHVQVCDNNCSFKLCVVSTVQVVRSPLWSLLKRPAPGPLNNGMPYSAGCANWLMIVSWISVAYRPICYDYKKVAYRQDSGDKCCDLARNNVAICCWGNGTQAAFFSFLWETVSIGGFDFEFCH